MCRSTRSLGLVLVALHLVAAAGVSAQQLPAPAVVATDYTLAATYFPEQRLITGSGRIRWRNSMAVPATELRLLTPWNSRRHDRTTWARERQLLGHASIRDDSRGLIDLSKVALLTPVGAVDVSRLTRAIAPDDRNVEDATVLALALEPEVLPGQSVEVEISWTARVPALADGFGARGPFVLAADWFPRVGVFTDDGWHAHQTHANLPRSAAFGRYEVALTLPSSWTVGATGHLTASHVQDNGTTTRRFEAEGVTDFAWVASPAFVERVERITTGEAPTTVRLLMQREHSSQSERHLAAVKAALASYTRWFGAPPPEALTIADVPEGLNAGPPDHRDGLVAAHPGVIAVHTPWIAPWAGSSPESAVIEGVGGQYWHATTGVIVDEHVWLEEGLGTYLTRRAVDETFPGRFVRIDRYFSGLVAWPNADVRQTRSAAAPTDRLSPASEPPTAPGWQQHPSDRAVNARIRVPLALLTLERSFGWEATRLALAAHLRGSRGRHPTPNEFFAMANSAAGRDLTWFFDATLRNAPSIDFGITNVTVSAAGAGLWESAVAVGRLADGVLPVDVRVVFDDGSSVVERWDGRAASHTYHYTRGASVATVEIDPERVLALEANRTNNSWTSRPRGRNAAAKWALRWAVWFQHLLMTYAFLA